MIYVQATNLHDEKHRVRYGRQLEDTPKRSLAFSLLTPPCQPPLYRERNLAPDSESAPPDGRIGQVEMVSLRTHAPPRNSMRVVENRLPNGSTSEEQPFVGAFRFAPVTIDLALLKWPSVGLA